ncbi:MAG: 1-phosphofructokinase family hexose kinase [Armatimonadetes bacterium]|nr:1-phosphofructokinase family hexose kinase [Armatimonadota bacterium]
MILSITLNAAVDHILFINGLKPHDTNRVQTMQTDAGGKGINLSRIAVELGAKSIATGFLGGGPGAFIKHVLDCQGVEHDFIETAEETRTNLNVESGDGPPTTFNAKGHHVTESEWSQLLEKVQPLLVQADWVAMGGSLPPGVPTDAFRTLGRLAKEHNCKVMLDADGEPMQLGLECVPDLIKPNVREAERLLNRELVDKEDAICEAAKELQAQLKNGGSHDPVVIISRGKKGAILADELGILIGEGIEVQSASTIGSGDSMLGGYLYALETRLSREEALQYGLAAGAATAITDGTEIGRKPVILDLLARAVVRRM